MSWILCYDWIRNKFYKVFHASYKDLKNKTEEYEDKIEESLEL